MQYYKDNYEQFLPADKDAPILDIGCGDGAFVRYLASLGYRNIVAIDFDSEAMAEFADVRGVRQIVSKIDAQSLKTVGNGFALIIMKQMIYYFDRKDVHAFLQSVHAALADDGKIAVEIFNGSMPSARFTQAKDAYILTCYTEHSLRALLNDNGFEVTFLEGARIAYGNLYRLARRLFVALYKASLVLDRGFDGQIPKVTSKSVIAIAKKRHA